MPLSLLFLFFHLLTFATPLDFSQYQIGFNNRPLLESIIRELVAEYGVPVRTAYGDRFMVREDLITIQESQLDQYMAETTDPKEREAIARFILTHEYFHIYLKHSWIRDEFRAPKEIEIPGSFSKARQQMEQQVDHLAARHVHKLRLPIEPLRQLFLRHPELHGGENYPSAEERAKAVALAVEPEIHESYFDNSAVRCVALLGELGKKLRFEPRQQQDP